VTAGSAPSRVIAGAVTRWVGVPLEEGDERALAADLVAMVDGFATIGPRAARALAARRRQERGLSKIISGVRAKAPAAEPLSVVAHHTDEHGLLDPRTAVVLLNIIRPTTAVAWLDSNLPPQNTDTDLSRIPARPRSGIEMVVP
jgi:fatty-acid peroxygenase